MSDLTSLIQSEQTLICQEIIRFHLLNARTSGQCEVELHKKVVIDVTRPISLLAFWHDSPALADSKPNYHQLVDAVIQQLKDSGVLPKQVEHKLHYVLANNCASGHTLAMEATLQLQLP